MKVASMSHPDPGPNEKNRQLPYYWSIPLADVTKGLLSGKEGLASSEARKRLGKPHGAALSDAQWWTAAKIFFAQINNPITLLLIGAALLSLWMREHIDATVILTIVFFSSLLSFWQEHTAMQAVARLLAMIATKATVRRDGATTDIPTDQVVPGDLVLLSAGKIIPGDCRLIEGHDLFVNEAALTGETFPVEKHVADVAEGASLVDRTNCVFQGTNVVSGAGEVIVVRVGADTELGSIANRLRLRPPETEFEHGIRHFGAMLMQVTMIMLLVIFMTHVWMKHLFVDTFLFALALAVGLTPQLLPAIISVTLAFGARKLAQQGVIVRKLSSIENFGGIDVLCSDKTGTLTEGVIEIAGAVDLEGKPSDRVMRLAYLNASMETGFQNPIDEAIRKIGSAAGLTLDRCTKRDEIPYDFVRKRLTVLADTPDGALVIVKGAESNVIEVCTRVATGNGESADFESLKAKLSEQYTEFGKQGLRVLGIASKPWTSNELLKHEDERDLTFEGFLLLRDPPKPNIGQTIVELKQMGVRLVMITGDNRHVAKRIATDIGCEHSDVVCGAEIHKMSDEALRRVVNRTNIFAEIEPNQKERIIRSYKSAGHVVGYLGDGINDATALHAADVGISVDSGVDVAKEAADIVLMQHDLQVLLEGIRQGRATFVNTLKYIFLATSANFGNMFSMAGASLFLPFLPLLPKQVLLTNLLTDLPEMMIAHDRVDEERLAKPQRWDLKMIQRFMLVFGAISSVFDFLTFACLWWIFGFQEYNPGEFRTGWFVESVVSACLIVLVMRSRKPFWQTHPAPVLAAANVVAIGTTIALPYTPLAEPLGFVALPVTTLAALLGIAGVYAATAETAKHWFFAHGNGN